MIERKTDDIDWYVISVDRLKRWALILVIVLASAVVAYFLYSRTRRSPEEKAKVEIAHAEQLLGRASGDPALARPGSNLAQARDLLRTAKQAQSNGEWDEAFRLAVESQSYSQRASSGSGAEESGDASVIFVEGDVSVQSAGRASFEAARQRQALYDGDFIKTGKSGSTEIMFSDGTLYTIRSGSLFEVRRPSGSEAGGSKIKMISGTVNVYTSNSSSIVATDAATANVAKSSRVGIDVAPGEMTEVTTYLGKATVSTSKETVVLNDHEKIAAGVRTGITTAKVVLPESPQMLLPPDNRVYDLRTGDQIDIRWKPVKGAVRYRLQISRSRLFVPDTTDVDLDDRVATSARVKVSREGAYFWRVAAINANRVGSDWSAVRRFKMLAEPPPAQTGTGLPPPLTVSTPQQMGNLFLIFGKTAPGAIVTVNAEPADVETDGAFKKTITLDREGYALLTVKAVDAAGNETVKKLRVFVEPL
ncbi:MAG: FecR domain-containing protein [Thermoanaerobaculia bacterium]